MNSCILTAEIIKNPELRATADNQLEIASMFVQFASPGNRPEDTPSTIEVVGWGSMDRQDTLAKEIKENYKQGDWVTIEGRLEMNTIERDGYKEKRARLVASKIYRLAPMGGSTPSKTAASAASSSPPPSSRAKAAPKVEEPAIYTSDTSDEIPF